MLTHRVNHEFGGRQCGCSIQGEAEDRKKHGWLPKEISPISHTPTFRQIAAIVTTKKEQTCWFRIKTCVSIHLWFLIVSALSFRKYWALQWLSNFSLPRSKSINCPPSIDCPPNNCPAIICLISGKSFSRRQKIRSSLEPRRFGMCKEAMRARSWWSENWRYLFSRSAICFTIWKEDVETGGDITAEKISFFFGGVSSLHIWRMRFWAFCDTAEPNSNFSAPNEIVRP